MLSDSSTQSIKMLCMKWSTVGVHRGHPRPDTWV